MRLLLCLFVLTLTVPMTAGAMHDMDIPPEMPDCIKVDPWNPPYVWTYPCDPVTYALGILP